MDRLEPEGWRNVRAVLADPERPRDDLDAMIEAKRRRCEVTPESS